MRAFAALIIIGFIGSGCGAKLRPDPFPPAIQSGYPTAEIRADGALWNGLAIVRVKRGEPLERQAIAVQGYYKGSVRITSDRCALDVSRQYADSELIKVPLAGTAEKSCVIAITLNPEFPNQKDQSIVVRGLRGYVALIVTDNADWVGHTFKVSGPWHRTFRARVGGTGDVRVVLDGCGKRVDKTATLDAGGYLNFDISDAVDKTAPSVCVVTGVVISPVFKDLLVSAIVATYKPDFTPLSVPTVTFDEDTLVVEGSAEVTAIAWQDPDRSVVGLSNILRINHFVPRDGQTIRLATVGGRLVVGEWKGEGFEWTQ